MVVVVVVVVDDSLNRRHRLVRNRPEVLLESYQPNHSLPTLVILHQEYRSSSSSSSSRRASFKGLKLDHTHTDIQTTKRERIDRTPSR